MLHASLPEFVSHSVTLVAWWLTVAHNPYQQVTCSGQLMFVRVSTCLMGCRASAVC